MNKPKRPRPFGVGPNVRVRVHSGPDEKGRWRWRADRQLGKGRKSFWSGWAATAEEAHQEVEAVLRERGEEWTAPEDVVTVADLLEVYTADKAKDDRSAYTTRARNGCADRIGDSPLAAVHLRALGKRPVAVRTLTDFVRNYTGAKATLRSDLITLAAAWRWGQTLELVPDTELPVPTIQVRREDAVHDRYVPSPDEVVAVLDRLRTRRTRPPLWPWRAVLLLWATGCRPGEIAALTWENVSPDARILWVSGKTGERRVALHSSVASLVATWPRTGPTVHGAKSASVLVHLHNYVFRAQREVEAEWQQVDPEARCPHWTLYGLRRAAVDQLYDRRRDPSVSAAAMGHSPGMAMAIYRTITDDDLIEAAEEAGLGVVPEGGKVVPLRRPRRK
jgi:integrase